jgi:glycosyltransferase involved in cell wall biosynthesis
MSADSSRPLQVLHLHSGNMIGGIETVQLSIADYASVTPKVSHSFALTFDRQLAASLRAAKVPVHLLPAVRLRHLPSIYQSRRQLRALLKESSFDIVVAHSPWAQTIFGSVMREAGIPVAFWVHGAFDGHWLQTLASFSVPTFAICNSEYTQSTLARCYPKTPSAVVRYPVAPNLIGTDREATRAGLGLAKDDAVILIAARMEAWKGHVDLLHALRQVKSVAPWKLLVAGKPNTPKETAYFESLQKQASDPSLCERVHFLGHRSDVPALMVGADVYCQPNRDPEPFGVVYVEALQAGVPVVTSRWGGAREILDQNTGILVEPGDSGALVRALTEVIENRELRIRLGKAGPARAFELCDPARQMQMISDTLHSVVEQQRRAPAK